MDNILVLADTHLPFERRNYLDFCVQTKKKYRCKKIVHIGDLVDQHAISFHEHDPNGRSAADETKLAKAKVKQWIKAFKEVKICKGNHDILPERQARNKGIPKDFIKSFKDVYELPKTWQFEWDYVINGVRFQHGTGYNGLYPQAQASKANMQNTVIGHCHSVAGTIYSANDNRLIYGLSVGCGIDRKKYAFWYGKDFKYKPILGCGVILENGKLPHFEPMRI